MQQKREFGENNKEAENILQLPEQKQLQTPHRVSVRIFESLQQNLDYKPINATSIQASRKRKSAAAHCTTSLESK